jgi:hypothetical protein
VVRDRGNQPPVDTGQGLCRLKIFAVLGQGGFDFAKKLDDIGLVQASDVTQITIFNASQRAVVLNTFNKRIKTGAQLGIGLLAQKPDDGLRFTQGQRGAQIGDVLIRNVFEIFIHGDVLHVLITDFFKEFQDVAFADFNHVEVRYFLGQAGHGDRLARAGHDMYRFSSQLFEIGERQRGIMLRQNITSQKNGGVA